MSKKTYLIVIAFVLWAAMILYSVLTAMLRDTRPPTIQHYVVSGNENFRELWQLNDAYTPAYGDSQALSANEEHIVFLGSFGQNTRESAIHVLDPSTGQIVTNISVSSRTHALAFDEHAVYISIDSSGKIDSNALNGASQVVAYDIESGKRVWEQRIRGARGVSQLFAYGETVLVVGSTIAGKRYQRLDVFTGKVDFSDDTYLPVFYNGDIWYMLKPPSSVLAKNGYTTDMLWEHVFDPRSVHTPPMITSGVIVGRTGQEIGQLYGIDSATGTIMWILEDGVYSNVVVDRSIAYFITEYAELKAVNVKTGGTLAVLRFEPMTPQEQLTQHRIYNVAVSDDIVVVYLGDSRQLFAFRFVR